ARRRDPGLQRQDRLTTRNAPGDMSEGPRIAEGLEVEKDEVGAVVVLPPLEQVVRRDVGLVPDRSEGGESECALGRLLQESEPEGAALRRKADPAGRKRTRSERRIEPDRRHGDTEAVRADHARAVCPNECEQPV